MSARTTTARTASRALKRAARPVSFSLDSHRPRTDSPAALPPGPDGRPVAEAAPEPARPILTRTRPAVGDEARGRVTEPRCKAKGKGRNGDPSRVAARTLGNRDCGTRDSRVTMNSRTAIGDVLEGGFIRPHPRYGRSRESTSARRR